jgi:hypothetical protein
MSDSKSKYFTVAHAAIATTPSARITPHRLRDPLEVEVERLACYSSGNGTDARSHAVSSRYVLEATLPTGTFFAICGRARDATLTPTARAAPPSRGGSAIDLPLLPEAEKRQ